MAKEFLNKMRCDVNCCTTEEILPCEEANKKWLVLYDIIADPRCPTEIHICPDHGFRLGLRK